MSNWFKGLFEKKCNCEGHCCEDKKTADAVAPIQPKEEATTTENVVPTEENKV